MSSLAVAFHFTASFILLVAFLGAALVAAGRSQLSPAGKATRGAFSAGWLMIAAGTVLYGGDLLRPEPATAALALNSAGYLLLVIGLVSAFRARVEGLTWLWVAIGLLIASDLAMTLPEAFHWATPALFSQVAAALPLLGGIAVSAWLWESIRASIQARFMALFTVLLLAVVVVLSGAMTNLFARNTVSESLRRAAQEADVQGRLLDSQIEESVSRARQVAELDSVRIAMARRDPVLAATVDRLQAPGGPFDTSDFMAFFDQSGALFALSAKGRANTLNLQPEEAVALAGTKVVKSAINQIQAGSVDTLGSRKVALIGAYPIFNPPGFDPPGAARRLAGAVALGRVIDNRYLERAAAGEERRSFLIGRDRVLLGTGPGGRSVIPRSETSIRRIFDEGRIVTLRGDIGGQEYFSSYVPLTQPDGKVVAALVLSEKSTVLAETQRDLSRTVLLLALGAAALAALLSFLSASKISRPIVQLTEAAERLRAGDLSARVESRAKDEVGTLAQTFDEMADSLGRVTEELRKAVETEAGLRSRFETILYSMTDGVVAVDPRGRVVAINREAERILGISRKNVAGAAVVEVLSVTDSNGAPVRLPIQELKAGSVRGFVMPTRGGPKASPDYRVGNGQVKEGDSGEPTPVEVTSAPILNDLDEAVGAVAVVRDLTGEMQVERMKTAFLSNVSHELRTPLTPIKGYADLLKRKDVPKEKAVTFLEGISQSAEKLERIIDMLIDFSAMEAGRLSPRKSPVDLNRVTEEIVEKAKAEAHGHEFERKGFSKVPEVEVDPKLVPIAIAELVDNAVKFSPEGSRVVVSADLLPTNNGHGELRISVSDNGIGIGKKELSAISESFSQVDQSATRAYGGLGLGLAYIQRIVEAHRGRLEVKSAPSRGSSFTMILPVARAPEPASTKGKRRQSR